MTEELQEYLKNDQLPFSNNELTEVILMIYNLIDWTIRDRCPIIEVSEQTVVRRSSKDNSIFKEFLTPVDFRPVFELVIERDAIIKRHLRLLDQTEIKSTYCIE